MYRVANNAVRFLSTSHASLGGFTIVGAKYLRDQNPNRDISIATQTTSEQSSKYKKNLSSNPSSFKNNSLLTKKNAPIT